MKVITIFLISFLFLISTVSAQEWVFLDSGVTNDLNAISCPDEQTCYVAGGAPYIGGSAVILKTEDGGENWISQPLPTTSPLRGIDCIDYRTCYAAGGEILKTVNGETWTIVDDRDAILWDVDATSSTHAVAVGNLGTKLRTTDGSDWNGYMPPTFGPFEETLLGVMFTSESVGWAVGQGGTMLYTDDGGETWFARDPNNSGLGLSDIFSLDGETIWACGSYTHIIKSVDGGWNWERYRIPDIGGCGAIEFANETFGWFFGNGAIERSEDGGLTWEVQEGLERLLFFRDLECFGPNLCYGVGDDGTIIRYGEAGADLPVAEIEDDDVETIVENESIEEPEERGELRAVYNDSTVFMAYPECSAVTDDCEAGWNPVFEYDSYGCAESYICVEDSVYYYVNNVFSQDFWGYTDSLNDVPGLGNERVNIYITKNDGSQVIAGVILKNKEIESVAASELAKPSFTLKMKEETLQKIASAENPREEVLLALKNKEIYLNAITPVAKLKVIISKFVLAFY